MRTRLVVAASLVVLLAASAGCAALFGDGISDEQLDAHPPEAYDWNGDHNVTVHVHSGGFVGSGTYRAVYDLEAINRSELRLSVSDITRDRPLSIRAVRYRYPNGTVINGSHPAVRVDRDGSERVVETPDAEGHIAYTADTGRTTFASKAFADGSYEVILPPNRRVGSLLFGDVNPGGYETSVDDENRVHVAWEDVSASDEVSIRYYHQRDVLLFRGLVVLVVVGGALGFVYFRRKIRQMERERRELGLDADTDDDRDPPPGMG